MYLFKLNPSYQFHRSVELIPNTLVVRINCQRLLEVGNGLSGAEDSEVRDTTAVEGLGVLRIDGDRLGCTVSANSVPIDFRQSQRNARNRTTYWHRL